MNILSLFDGMGCGRLALERAGIEVTNYYASEIDKHAMKVAAANYPDIVHIGDVEQVTADGLPQIDLLIGGSPCQGFSNDGKGLNFKDPRSKLFFDYVRLLEECKPRYFFLENVKMKHAWRDIITEYLGVKPIMIDSALVSAQKRRRYYWTNIPGITQPEDRGVMLDDIIDLSADSDEAYHISEKYINNSTASKRIEDGDTIWRIPQATVKGYIDVTDGDYVDLDRLSSTTRRGRSMVGKSNCIMTSPEKYCRVVNGWFRSFTPTECERLQTVPDNYTAHVSNTQRYKMLGNGWTVDVIAHMFRNITEPVQAVPGIRQASIFDFAERATVEA